MTKKNIGLAKTKVIRIHSETMQQLNAIKTELGMHKSHNEGDVVKQLIAMYNSKKIGDTPFLVRAARPNDASTIQTKLDEYESAFTTMQQTNQTLVKAVTYASEKLGITYPELIEIVKYKRVQN